MDFCFELIKIVTTSIASTSDVVSDFLLSLDFLGIHIKSTIVEETFNITMSEPKVQPAWGYIALGIIFLPGIILMPIFINFSIVDKNKNYILIGLPLIPLYPFAMIVFQFACLFSLCKHRVLSKEVASLAMILTGTEAFWESFTQMVFQGYVILN